MDYLRMGLPLTALIVITGAPLTLFSGLHDSCAGQVMGEKFYRQQMREIFNKKLAKKKSIL